MTSTSLRGVLLFTILSFALGGQSLDAATSKTITREFATDDLKTLELDVTTAEVDIEVYDGDNVQVEVTLEAHRRFFGLRAGSVDDIELEVRQSPDKLFLGLDQKNLDQHWVLLVPGQLAMIVHVNIGDVDIQKVKNNLDMEVGVGSIQVDVIEAVFRDIHVATGVGDATIQGMQNRADHKRSVVSASATYRGEGTHHVDIQLGVGDVKLRNE